MNNFVKERNEALLSLDEKKIDAYMKKYNPLIKKPKDKKFIGLVYIKQFVIYF